MNKRSRAIMHARYSSEHRQRSSNADQTTAEGPSDATVASRPALKNLLDYIERSRGRIAGLIVDDISRLGRCDIDDLIVDLAKKR